VIQPNWSGFDFFAIIKTVPGDLEIEDNPATKGDVIYLNYNEGETDQDAPINDAGFYMRWGHLLQFINDNVISVIKGSDANGKPTKIVDINFDTWGNKMYTLPYQVSLDPRVCIVKSLDDINSKKYYQELNDFKNAKFDFAWPMNIYLSHNQIIASLNENLDEKGNIALFDFLNSLCVAVNKAMGGINNLEPFLDEDTNTLYIIDASYQPKPKLKPYTLQLYGYDKNQSGFVRNFNLKTEITSDFATMASIGSTAGGYVKGTENTMFSKWNKGLIDRWKEEYEAADIDSRPVSGSIAEPNKMYVEEFWNKQYSPFGYTLMDIADDSSWFGYGDSAAMNDDIIDSNISIVTEFYKYIQAKIQEEQQGKYSSPSNGFIPINLGITMDGISGIKIYNEVNVDTRFLPANYPKSLRFIIKGVNHKLSDSDWETTLETVVIAKTNDESNPALTQIEIKEIMDKYIKGAVESSGVGSGVGSNIGGAPGGASGGAPGGAGGAGASEPNTTGIEILNNSPSPSSTPKLKKAVIDQSNYAFKSLKRSNGAIGEVSGLCAGYTFNIAYKLKSHLDKNSTKAIPWTWAGSGNANQIGLRTAIEKLGLYDKIWLGSFKAKDLKKSNSLIYTTKWNYGDILIYYSPSSSGPSNMHAQIYTGDIFKNSVYWDASKNKTVIKNNSNSGWTTSNATNYGGKFIYPATDTIFSVFAYKVKSNYLI
jgi:hypothetical protein